MRINLKKVRWKNFLSTGNQWTEILLTDYALTLIIGKNGSGKTTFLDALSFGLFNKSFRRINKPQLVNAITGKDCAVEIEFEINGYEIKVCRGVKPNFFEIYKDDKLVPQSPDIRDYQDLFEKYILGVDHKTFCQVVMLGSAVFTPFMALPAQLRREVIEDLLDLKIFTRMNIILKDKYQFAHGKVREIQFKKKMAEQKYDLLTKHLDQTKEEIEKAIEEISKDIVDDHISMQQADVDADRILKELEDLIANKVESPKKLTKLAQFKAQLESKIKMLNDEINFYHDNDTCPACAQEIDEEIKELNISSKSMILAEVEGGLSTLVTQYQEEGEKLRQFDIYNEKLRKAQLEYERVIERIKLLEKSIQSKENGILKLKAQLVKKEETTNIEELNAELLDLDSKLLEAKEDESIMDFGLTLLKDTGIKSQFIKTYIPIINNLIQQYLTQLDFYVEFTLNENFQETIKSRYLDEFSYESFSEGEKARLNIAVLMTWRTLAKMRGSIDCNLLVLDELLDGPLDNEGLEEILKLLGRLTNNQNVYIISHKEDQISDKFSRTIKFEKTRNFSRIV